MPRSINGVQSILRDAEHMCRMVERFGTSALALQTSEELATAVLAVAAACQVLKTLDDFVGKVDRTVGGFGDINPV
jgi:hypothetical protein